MHLCISVIINLTCPPVGHCRSNVCVLEASLSVPSSLFMAHLTKCVIARFSGSDSGVVAGRLRMADTLDGVRVGGGLVDSLEECGGVPGHKLVASGDRGDSTTGSGSATDAGD